MADDVLAPCATHQLDAQQLDVDIMHALGTQWKRIFARCSVRAAPEPADPAARLIARAPDRAARADARLRGRNARLAHLTARRTTPPALPSSARRLVAPPARRARALLAAAGARRRARS
jgi:hypothetical protein